MIVAETTRGGVGESTKIGAFDARPPLTRSDDSTKLRRANGEGERGGVSPLLARHGGKEKFDVAGRLFAPSAEDHQALLQQPGRHPAPAPRRVGQRVVPQRGQETRGRLE